MPRLYWCLLKSSVIPYPTLILVFDDLMLLALGVAYMTQKFMQTVWEETVPKVSRAINVSPNSTIHDIGSRSLRGSGGCGCSIRASPSQPPPSLWGSGCPEDEALASQKAPCHERFEA
ncbi:hypothetical protein Nepgr_023408 [Nepenthes gracilis]|uniref:Uncharacterized protein n=1 Tax=Nepenthes gracilis TaxID=150966 RepID=A0AAD3T2U0_NEPGR|nr:hypothetical protein Nepgr_023408 [Nepenthes gracilis]